MVKLFVTKRGLPLLESVRFVAEADVATLWCVNQAYGQEKCGKKKAANATQIEQEVSY